MSLEDSKHTETMKMDEQEEDNLRKAEKEEEAKLKAKYPQVLKPGGSSFLQKILHKGQKYFDSEDYNMAKAKGQKARTPLSAMAQQPTRDTIPTPDTLPTRKTSLVQTKEKKKREESTSGDSNSSDSNSESENEKSGENGTRISIKEASHFQIGSRYKYSVIHNSLKQQNIYQNIDQDVQPATSLKEEIANSERQIEIDDIYLVAGNISKLWKKLVRFLPPGNAFTTSEMMTFYQGNDKDIEECVADILLSWRDNYPELATIGNLATTVDNTGRVDLANQLIP